MRILHVTDCYLPQLGGIEMHVHDLATRQRDGGDDAQIVTTTPAVVDDDPTWVSRLGQTRDGTGARLTRALDQLSERLSNQPVDVVHVHVSVLSPFATAAARLTGSRGIPTLVTVHSLWSRLGPLPAVACTLLRLRDWPLTWSAVSDRAAEPLRAMLGPSMPVYVLPNAVDIEHWRRVGQQAVGASSPTPTIISVMRMTRRKRPLPLLRMLQHVRMTVPPTQPFDAVIIGDGPQRSAVERFLRRHRMEEWVRLTGAMDRAEIRRELAVASVNVAPAQLESFGLAALEARTVGLPVVACSRGGVGEFVVHRVNGLLTVDDDDMVSALAELVMDGASRAELTANNRAQPPLLDWSTVCRLNADLYAHTMGRAGYRGRAARVGARP
jgi:glycosyltransferase involved in cell wall biosynthesis